MKRMERLSGDFISGYTRAIIDIKNELVSVQYDLKCHHKRLMPNFVYDALRLFLEHRENFRERADGFIRWNTKKQELEYFSPYEERRRREREVKTIETTCNNKNNQGVASH